MNRTAVRQVRAQKRVIFTDPHRDDTRRKEKNRMNTREKFRAAMAENETETALGEPQWWVYLKSGRSIEVTLESAGLPDKRRYCSVRLHCSEDEFDRDQYHGAVGVIDSQCTADIEDRTVNELLDEAANIAVAIADAEHEAIA